LDGTTGFRDIETNASMNGSSQMHAHQFYNIWLFVNLLSDDATNNGAPCISQTHIQKRDILQPLRLGERIQMSEPK